MVAHTKYLMKTWVSLNFSDQWHQQLSCYKQTNRKTDGQTNTHALTSLPVYRTSGACPDLPLDWWPIQRSAKMEKNEKYTSSKFPVSAKDFCRTCCHSPPPSPYPPFSVLFFFLFFVECFLQLSTLLALQMLLSYSALATFSLCWRGDGCLGCSKLKQDDLLSSG